MATRSTDRELNELARVRHEQQLEAIVNAAIFSPRVALAVVAAIALALAEEGNAVTAAGRKGHLGISKQWADAATRVRGIAERLRPLADAEPEDKLSRETLGAIVDDAWREPEPGDPRVRARPEFEVPDPPTASVVQSGPVHMTLAAGERAEMIDNFPGDMLGPPEDLTTLETASRGGVRDESFKVSGDEPYENPRVANHGAPFDLGYIPVLRDPWGNEVGSPGWGSQNAPDVTDQLPTEEPAATAPVVSPFASPKGVIPNPPRLTWDDINHAAAVLDPHLTSSYSQVSSIASCGMKHLIGRMSRHGWAEPAKPAWSLVGGTAFHKAVEVWESHGYNARSGLLDPKVVWLEAFNEAVEEARTTAPERYQDPHDWHAANRGKENYDWWRVEGQKMLNLWTAYMTPERRERVRVAQFAIHGGGVADVDYQRAWELEYHMALPNGIVTHGFMDCVWYDVIEGGLAVIDLKTGARMPQDTFQLGEYAHALVRVFGVNPALTPISAGYYDARRGVMVPIPGILERHPIEELEARHGMAANAKEARVFLPNVTNFCVSCGFEAQCPARG